MRLDKEFVNFLNSSHVESFSRALTNQSYISAGALQGALSLFGDEANSAVVYILETNFAIRTNGQSLSTLRELKQALESLLGAGSGY